MREHNVNCQAFIRHCLAESKTGRRRRQRFETKMLKVNCRTLVPRIWQYKAAFGVQRSESFNSNSLSLTHMNKLPSIAIAILIAACSAFAQTAPDAAELTRLLNEFLAGASRGD